MNTHRIEIRTTKAGELLDLLLNAGVGATFRIVFNQRMAFVTSDVMKVVGLASKGLIEFVDEQELIILGRNAKARSSWDSVTDTYVIRMLAETRDDVAAVGVEFMLGLKSVEYLELDGEPVMTERAGELVAA
jgi:hypothetical protein